MATTSRRTGGIAFALAALGHHAAERFGARIAELELSPPHAGILRAIAAEPGRSQQALSAQLGLLPSRVVAFIDELERRGVVERRRNPDDRRLHALYLTDSGTELMGEIARIGRAHEAELTAGLTKEQRTELAELLQLVTRRQGLTPGVHPGYRTLGKRDADAE